MWCKVVCVPPPGGLPPRVCDFFGQTSGKRILKNTLFSKVKDNQKKLEPGSENSRYECLLPM